MLKAPNSPDSVPKRKKRLEFDQFEHLFKTKHAELAEGVVTLAPVQRVDTVQEGWFFVLNGIILSVAWVGETMTTVVGSKPAEAAAAGDRREQHRVLDVPAIPLHSAPRAGRSGDRPHRCRRRGGL